MSLTVTLHEVLNTQLIAGADTFTSVIGVAWSAPAAARLQASGRMPRMRGRIFVLPEEWIRAPPGRDHEKAAGTWRCTDRQVSEDGEGNGRAPRDIRLQRLPTPCRTAT